MTKGNDAADFLSKAKMSPKDKFVAKIVSPDVGAMGRCERRSSTRATWAV